jgi:hypothetical protein
VFFEQNQLQTWGTSCSHTCKDLAEALLGHGHHAEGDVEAHQAATDSIGRGEPIG